MYYCRIKHSGLLKNRFTYFQIGLIASISMVFFAFNIETERKEYKMIGDPYGDHEIIQQDIPRTAEMLKKLPPPPKPKATKIIMPVEEVPDIPLKETKQEPEPKLETYVNAKPIVKKVAPPKVVKPTPKPVAVELPPERVIDDVPVSFAAIMPMFPGCDEEEYSANKQCADKKMLEFVYKHLKYPAMAREVGVEGITVIQFVIDKDGSITKIKPLKELGSGCTKEAIRVIKKMPNWSPGIQNGRPVKVLFNLPVRFRLN